jgi:hypothetical protein
MRGGFLPCGGIRAASRRGVARALAVAVSGVLLAAGPFAPVARAEAPGCSLADLSTPPAACLACHPFQNGHPHNTDYDYAARASRSALRPLEEVVRRGLFLPEGRVVCHTCHDARSRWGSRLVIPPGSRVVGRVDPRQPSTYESMPPAERRMTVEQAARDLPTDTNLSPKPLCVTCHAFD